MGVLEQKIQELDRLEEEYKRQRGEYICQEMKYSTYRFDDVNHEHLLPGTKQVYVDFIF